jgi:hypothetical protein
MTCNLCKQPDVPLVDSHIIPKSICQSVAGIKGRIISDKTHDERSPSGVYDQIVCDECEKLFNSWDDAIVKFYKQILDNLPKNKPLPDFIEIKNYEYYKIKLFFISLLWRADVCNRSLFEDVDVGEFHRNKLSSMILNKNPGDIDDYTVMLNFFVGGEEYPFIEKVIKDKSLDNIVFYQFYIGGLLVLVKCSKNNIQIQDEQHSLNPNEPAKIYLSNFVSDDPNSRFQKVRINLKNHKNYKYSTSHYELGKKEAHKK